MTGVMVRATARVCLGVTAPLTSTGVATFIVASPAVAEQVSGKIGTTYPVVATGQTRCYSATGDRGGPQPCPKPGQPGYGQDAQFIINPARYRDNGDGTVSDLVTGLMWEKGYRENVSFAGAPKLAARARTGGHSDWRVPTTKELYSLINFSGTTGTMDSPSQSRAPSDAKPFIDTQAFDFTFPKRDRFIDAQYLTQTAYKGIALGTPVFFGVNFADGRIKGYPQRGRRDGYGWFGRFVRGNPQYGKNDFHDNGNGTVSDRATGLTWMRVDSGDKSLRGKLGDNHYKDGRMDWPAALRFCEGLTYGGASDWRVPNAKILQSLLDYSRSPSATDSAAIAPIFQTSSFANEAGQRDFPGYWASTSFLDGPVKGADAVVVYFGRALGAPSQMGPHGQGQQAGNRRPPYGVGPPPGGPQGRLGAPPQGRPPGGGGPGWTVRGADKRIIDVHGAGAQRSDPKTGSAARYPVAGFGPQGDVRRVYNYVRCVRTGG